jgi:hypothetical protein
MIQRAGAVAALGARARELALGGGLIRTGRPCTARTRRCDFWNWGGDYVRPDCCTAHLLGIAVFLRDLLARESIVHWLDFGSLLGAVREGRLVPWDSDVDLGILASDMDRVLALRPEIEARGHQMDLSESAVVRVNLSRRNLQHVDLYAWDLRDGMLSSPPAACDWPGTHLSKNFPASYLETLEQVTIDGEPFPAPSPVEAFLADHRYGPSFRTPMRPATERVHHLPAIGHDEMTPTVEQLLQEIGRAERTLGRLSFAPRGINSPLWRRWVDAGLPLTPRAERVERRRTALPPEERGAVTDGLLEFLDLVEQAIEERQDPRPRDAVIRSGRRVARALRR